MNIKKFIVISGAMTATFVAVMAFVHTPQGLAVWGRLRGSKACPYGMDGASSPQSRDAHRAAESAGLRGEGRARSTSFLGFKLDATKRSDVDVWVVAQNAKCHSTHISSADLECKVMGDAPRVGPAVPEGTVFFAFDSRGILKSVHSMMNYADAGEAAQAFAQLRDETNEKLGAEPKLHGESSPEYLSANVLRQVAAEYRLEDVYARLSATHMPVSYIVEQKFRSTID